MASTSELCPGDLLERRNDLVIRPLPEISLCMVYRPRPARIITLNPSSWLLLELCNGTTLAAIEEDYARMLAERGQTCKSHETRSALGTLVELQLVKVATGITAHKRETELWT
jgi:hypothetical protein